MVFRRHFQFRSRDGNGKYHVLLSACYFRQVLQEVVKLGTHAAAAAAAGVVHQFIHEDEARLVLRQELADHFARWRGHLRFMLCHHGQSLLSSKLPGDFAPRRFPQWRSVCAAPTGDGIEFSANEHGGFGVRDAGHSRAGQQLRHPSPLVRSGAVPCQMIKQRERVRLASAELRGEIKNSVRLGFLPAQPADDFGGKCREIFCKICPLEKPFGLLVIVGRPAFADLVKMHGKFRGIERLALAQILARGDDFIPGFDRHGDGCITFF